MSITGTVIKGGAVRFTVTHSGPIEIPIPAIAGAPFAAEQVREHTQTLNDGTRIQRAGTLYRLFRDSAGRTRSEHSMEMGQQTDHDLVIVEISDPLAGHQYLLDTVNRVAHRLRAPATRANLASVSGGGVPAPSTPPPPAPAAALNPNRTQFVNESLGSQMIEGVLVEGKRTTTTIPAGRQGNDRPLTSVSESWFSQELRMIVLSKTTSPTSGESIRKLININRAEPDPSLFQAPPDYRIIDEQDPFKMEVFRR